MTDTLRLRRTVHPFPARMASELAIRELQRGAGLRVLDPMAGSGTVIREACRRGHTAQGLDCDPLAVLMGQVWITPVEDRAIVAAAEDILRLAASVRRVELPWIDGDLETSEFVDYWFAPPQRDHLRKLAYAIRAVQHRRRGGYRRGVDVASLALSRTIVTKDLGASLARDVSHSRPHRVADSSTFDVPKGFQTALQHIRRVLAEDPPSGGGTIKFGDARSVSIENASVDLVLTSPPYLNAIDYIRGHRLALVWLGYDLQSLRRIRAEAIGTERGMRTALSPQAEKVRDAIADVDKLSSRHRHLVARYAFDVQTMMNEVARVLHQRGRAVFVVGNSCLRGEFIQNSEGVKVAAIQAGLKLTAENTRELPEQRRYLPLKATKDAALSKRMRTECVLRFRHA